MGIVRDPMERFFEKVEVLESGCWQWTASLAVGYGRFSIRERPSGWRLAHRWLYEQWLGPIPDGLVLDHLCRNRACVNPDHLEPVTHGENLRRGVGLTAINARKTHCVHGHPLADGNVYLDRKGFRSCLICRREAHKRNEARKHGAELAK